jgi:ABC-type branched-subunit amino acid transport system ATPase component
VTGDAGLEVRDLTIRYGGIVAVEQLSLAAPLATITGLVGPNGAGKTTTFNACTGVVRPTSGQVRLFGDDVTRLAVQVRARRGLGRTYQRMELFDSLPVSQNVAMGAEARLAGNRPLHHFFSSASDRSAIRIAADDAIVKCGLAGLRDRTVASLSTGQRRLVDLARVVAGGFTMLLLDEPSSGLDTEETEQLGAVVSDLVAERGCGVLLVEHDMSLVMSVCSYLFVLDFGRPIFAGTPAAARTSDVVRAAYLGSEAA